VDDFVNLDGGLQVMVWNMCHRVVRRHQCMKRTLIARNVAECVALTIVRQAKLCPEDRWGDRVKEAYDTTHQRQRENFLKRNDPFREL